MNPGSPGYEAARASAALARLPDRGVLRATGPDRQKFLQAMLSNEVLGLQPGDGRAAALLDVKGHVQALLRVLAAKDAVVLEMNRDRIEPVKGILEHYKVAAPVRFAAADAAVLAVLGPEAEARLSAAGAAAFPAQALESHVETTLAGRAVRIVRAGDLAVPGFVLHAAEADAAALLAALLAAGAPELSPGALDALRVETGRPWFGRDVAPANLLHEAGLAAECCSFQKGCYLGQEVIARLDARGGHVNKRLVGLRLEAPTRDGAAVAAGREEVGRVTTAAVSARLGPVALAYLHRAHAEAGARVEVDGHPAAVTALPMLPEQPPS